MQRRKKGGADGPDFVAPDFVTPIYPDMAAMTVPADALPMFVAIAADDFLLARQNGLPLLESYRAAGKTIEFHLYSARGMDSVRDWQNRPRTDGWI